MLKAYVEAVVPNLYANAANELDLEVEVISKKYNLLKIHNHDQELLIKNMFANLNSVAPFFIGNNKELTYEMYKKAKIQVPESITIDPNLPDHFEQAIQFLEEYKNIVVKPLSESSGRGVFLNIQNKKDLQQAIDANRKYPELIIENFIEGHHYRVLVYKNEVIDIVQRIPAFVIGNGRDTIEKLIRKKNSVRNKFSLKEIKINHNIIHNISKYNLKLESIPQKDKYIRLRRNSNMATGGETKRIDLNTINKENLDYLGKVLQTTNHEYAGIDLITPFIKDQKTYFINEINTGPDISVNCLSDYKIDLTPSKKILKSYFELDE